jgi:hypothetical protein
VTANAPANAVFSVTAAGPAPITPRLKSGWSSQSGE